MDIYVIGYTITPILIASNQTIFPNTGEYVMVKKGGSRCIKSVTFDYENSKVYLEV